MLLKISKKDLQVKYRESKKGDIPHSKADITLAQNELGFSPRIEINEGLEKLFDVF